MSFDKIFDLTAGVYFNFYNICIYVSIRWTIKSWPRLMGSRRSAFQNENQIIKFRRFGGEGAPPPSIRAYSGRQKSVSYSAATGARCVVLALLEPMYCTISYYIILLIHHISYRTATKQKSGRVLVMVRARIKHTAAVQATRVFLQVLLLAMQFDSKTVVREPHCSSPVLFVILSL